MNFWEEAGGALTDVFDGVGDYVEGVGKNSIANAELTSANAKVQEANATTQLRVLDAAIEADKRADEQRNLIIIGSMSLFGILLLGGMLYFMKTQTKGG